MFVVFSSEFAAVLIRLHHLLPVITGEGICRALLNGRRPAWAPCPLTSRAGRKVRVRGEG
ncbi:hypothetical protein ACVJBD_002775 [Rhizobium mongolense]